MTLRDEVEGDISISLMIAEKYGKKALPFHALLISPLFKLFMPCGCSSDWNPVQGGSTSFADSSVLKPIPPRFRTSTENARQTRHFFISLHDLPLVYHSIDRASVVSI